MQEGRKHRPEPPGEIRAERPPEPGAASAQTPDGGVPPVATQPNQTPLPQSDRYRDLQLIGNGGTGKVYRALDVKLMRRVALKVFPGADETLERRLVQEAQAQARVEHPSVCKVYEIGRIGGQPYIAMQYVDGKTLRAVAKEMTLAQKLEVMRDVSAAVHAAHRIGLVHRDLKPANVLVARSEGGYRPFISDFGLARELDSEGGGAPAAMMGSPQYMAPEQARGEGAKIDARTDVYGLGATLYETLTDRPPLQGESNLQTLYKVLNEEPTPLRDLDPSVPAEVEAVVMKCLRKDPTERYDSAEALADDLQRALDGSPVRAQHRPGWRDAALLLKKYRAVAAAAVVLCAFGAALAAREFGNRGGSRKPVSVAVADFENETRDEGLDGLSGMLITSLEQSKRLQVLTRSRMLDVARQMGKGEPSRIGEEIGLEIAKQANAEAVVVGTVRKFGELYTIDVQLFSVSENKYVAGLREEGRGKASIPKLIDQLSRKVRRTLNEQAAEIRASQASVADLTTRSLEAYQHFFRGKQLLDQARAQAAVTEFRAATQLDPGFAVAWFYLAYGEKWLHEGRAMREALTRAAALKDRLPEKERSIFEALRATLDGNGEGAYRGFKSCVDRYPQEKDCIFALGDHLFHGGSVGASIEYFQRALTLDSNMERAYQHLAWAYQLTRQPQEMLATATGYVAYVGNDVAYSQLARAHAVNGDDARARATLGQAATQFPRSPLPSISLSALEAWLGDVDAAVAVLKPLLEPTRAPEDRKLGFFSLGTVLVQGGRLTEATQAFERAAQEAAAAGDRSMEARARTQKALALLVLGHDTATAEKEAERSRQRGLPEADWAYLYPLLGDDANYGRLLRAEGDLLAEKAVEVVRLRNRGRYTEAARAIEALASKWAHLEYLYYLLADTCGRAADAAHAVEALLRARDTFPMVTAPGFGFAAALRARSEYELGALYEQLGDRQRALEATERFLRAWRKADPNLPEVKSALERRSRLAARIAGR